MCGSLCDACEVPLCVVAIHRGGLCEGLLCIAVGSSLALTVLAQRVRDDTGGDVLSATLEHAGHIIGLVHILGCDAGHLTPVLTVGIGHGHLAGGVAQRESGDGAVGLRVPPVQGHAAVHSDRRGAVEVDGEGAVEGHRGIQRLEVGVVPDEAADLGAVYRHHRIDHGLVIDRHQRFLVFGQRGVDQLVGVMTEVQLSLSAVVHHGHRQGLHLSGIVAAEDRVGVSLGVVAAGSGIGIGAINELVALQLM